MKITLRQAGLFTALACELVGLLALWLTPEVQRPLFAAAGVAAAAAWIFRFSLRDRLLLLLVAFCVVAGYATAGGAPTGTLLARALIPAHALLWLAKDETAYRYWRLSVALMELVLAAILAPEAHMFILIFFFVVVSSLSLSFAFLERNFGRTDPASLGRPLRPAFVGAVLALSFLIFLSSLVIFPILPRSRWGGNATTAGYNDTVSLRQSILYWAKQDTRPVLWIFRPGEELRWEKVVPYFLLRGQPLEEFRADAWHGRPRAALPTRFPAGERVEIIRQPILSDALPVPYGTGRLSSLGDFNAARFDSGEWLAAGTRSRRVKYSVEVGSFPREALGGEPAAGQEGARRFPARIFPGIAKLAEELARGAASDEERVRRVQDHLRGFTYRLASYSGQEEGKRHPLETFLFDQKAGHCELFASAAAMLFRAMNMPSRLVVGFRVAPPRSGNVLTVHASDAHAWVEVYLRGKGWVPVDPTPVLEERGWVRELFGDVYDQIGAYWALYILEYELELPQGWLRYLGGAASALLVLYGCLQLWRRRERKLSNREKLSKVFAELEDDLIYRAGIYPEMAYRDLPEAREWRERYVRLRFGRGEPTEEDLHQMNVMAKHVLSITSSRAAPAPKSGA